MKQNHYYCGPHTAYILEKVKQKTQRNSYNLKQVLRSHDFFFKLCFLNHIATSSSIPFFQAITYFRKIREDFQLVKVSLFLSSFQKSDGIFILYANRNLRKWLMIILQKRSLMTYRGGSSFIGRLSCFTLKIDEQSSLPDQANSRYQLS